MRLEIGSFKVKDIVFGGETACRGGVLTVNAEEALRVVREDRHITEAELKIVRPGDMVRLCPVKDSVEFRCKVNGGEGAYPGVTSPLGQAGMGRTHVIDGATLLTVGRHWGGFQDGLIDMGGHYQHYTIWGDMPNLVLVADTDELDEQREQQKRNHAIRWAGLRLAEHIAQCIRDLEPDTLDVYELPPLDARGEEVKKLPGVVYVLQPQTQMEALGYNTLVYGWDGNRMLPTFMHPNEFLDGCLVSGSFMPSSSKISTYEFSTNPMIKRLYAQHGKTINFLGVILSTLNPKMEEKVRCVQMAGQIAVAVGAKGAVVAEEGYGNPDVDYTAMLVELERLGIKTIGISDEATGRDGASQPLVSMNPATDALVSTGNVSQFYELPAMEVIGELEALARDGNSGGWEGCINPDGSCVMENNGMFCANHISGYSRRSCADF
ncbi:MAG: glycine/sarcosine/betaine reductase component B subunit [Synergistaceae bacterium]|nr:glycine/sarcosine/betaine reductase component B subunit [Synergistaceae bacterium]